MRGVWPRKRRKSLDPGCFAQYTERKAKGGNGDETWRGNDLAGSEAGARHAADVYKIFPFRGSLGQLIFGVGTIFIHSSDKSAPHLELKNVKNPLVVKELIHKHVESMKTERGVRVSEFLDDGPKRHDPCTPPPKMEH